MSERVLMCGNEAMSEAAIVAGLDAYFGYPITPQNEVTTYMARRMAEEGRVFLQSESEIAAINMVFGAAAAGKRAMTTSSGPGISLMQEGLSYLAGAELPSVVVNVMRGGPGLGNIAPSQGDYFQATRGGGHGDYYNIVLAPASGQEMADLVQLAFDLADQYRITVMMIADGYLGQMMEPVRIEKRPSPPLPSKDWALTGADGREQNIVRSLWLKEGALEELNLKLQEKYNLIKKNEVRYEEYHIEHAEIILVAFGTPARICRSAIDQARKQGIAAGLLRPITLWPFPSERIAELAHEQPIFLTVEMNCGQMVDDVKLAVAGKAPVQFYGRSGGGVPTVEDVVEQIMQITATQRA